MKPKNMYTPSFAVTALAFITKVCRFFFLLEVIKYCESKGKKVHNLTDKEIAKCFSESFENAIVFLSLGMSEMTTSLMFLQPKDIRDIVKSINDAELAFIGSISDDIYLKLFQYMTIDDPAKFKNLVQLEKTMPTQENNKDIN
jgi:hypothetical protein